MIITLLFGAHLILLLVFAMTGDWNLFRCTCWIAFNGLLLDGIRDTLSWYRRKCLDLAMKQAYLPQVEKAIFEDDDPVARLLDAPGWEDC